MAKKVFYGYKAAYSGYTVLYGSHLGYIPALPGPLASMKWIINLFQIWIKSSSFTFLFSAQEGTIPSSKKYNCIFTYYKKILHT